ncbi:hypothetical protein [Nocardia seriolae]|uniref:hypothetical protein n=1 Tax=Nocardia seriolae TaxID=37332 RepID=UPI003F73CCEE
MPRFQDMVRDHEITYCLVPEVKLPDSWRVDPERGDQPQPADQAVPGQPTAQPGLWRPAGNKEILDWVIRGLECIRPMGMRTYVRVRCCCEFL